MLARGDEQIPEHQSRSARPTHLRTYHILTRHSLDNLATPLAGALGDLLALVILALVAKSELSFIGKPRYSDTTLEPKIAADDVIRKDSLWSTVVVVVLLAFVIMNIIFTLRNAYVQELIWGGWIPLLLALTVSRWVS